MKIKLNYSYNQLKHLHPLLSLHAKTKFDNITSNGLRVYIIFKLTYYLMKKVRSCEYISSKEIIICCAKVRGMEQGQTKFKIIRFLNQKTKSSNLDCVDFQEISRKFFSYYLKIYSDKINILISYTKVEINYYYLVIRNNDMIKELRIYFLIRTRLEESLSIYKDEQDKTGSDKFCSTRNISLFLSFQKHPHLAQNHSLFMNRKIKEIINCIKNRLNIQI